MAENLNEVVEIVDARSYEVNRYLKAGWRLLSIYLADCGERNPSQTPHYVLGWIPPERVEGRFYEEDYGRPVYPGRETAGSI
jgi:hypothetical protein